MLMVMKPSSANRSRRSPPLPFRIVIGAGILTCTIEGSVEIGETEADDAAVFVTISRCPSQMTYAKAQQLAADAIAKGNDIGLPPTFASRVHAALGAV